MKETFNKESIKDFIAKVFIIMGVLIFAFILILFIIRYDNIKNIINNFIKILYPFIYGAIIAYILYPLNNKIEYKLNKKNNLKRNKYISIFLTELIFMLILISVCALIIPQLLVSIKESISSIPYALNNLEILVANTVYKYEWIKELTGNNFKDIETKIIETLRKQLIPNISYLITNIAISISSILKIILNISIGLIVNIMLLIHRKKFTYNCKKTVYGVFGKSIAYEIINEIKIADKIFSAFFIGKIIDSLIIGMICFVTLTILNMPYTLLVSVIVGITNIIPFFGPFLGAIPSTVIILSVDPTKAMIFIVFIIILQQFDGNILGPKLIGNSTGLNTFGVLFSILVFGGLWGIIGMIIGVPLMAIISDIVSKGVNKLLKLRKINLEDIQ